MIEGDRDSRFARQVRLAEIGRAGQGRIAAAQVAILGCGATGGAAAMLLARAGVGRIRLVDRDLVELSNLPRQVLFDRSDLDPPTPKAVAAARALERIDGALELEPIVADITGENIRGLVAGVDLVVDGADNFQLRYLLNEACLEADVPWIYQAAVGVIGQTATIVGGQTACLTCWLPEPPPPEQIARCDTHGVLGAAVAAVAALAAGGALRMLVEGRQAADGRLHTVDAWGRQCGSLPLRRRAGCAACDQRDFRHLRGEGGLEAAPLCGRDAVQISGVRQRWDLKRLAERIEEGHGEAVEVRGTEHLLTIRRPPLSLRLFADGRAIVEGTTEASMARAFYNELIGM